jgi:hypothetical protein
LNKSIKLYLYWRDTIASVGGYLSSFAGLTDLTGKLSDDDLEDALVAVLSVKGVSRKAGSRRYETTIQAEERVFNALSRRVTASICMDSPLSILKKIEQETNITIHFDDQTFTPEGWFKSNKETTPAAGLAYLEYGKTYSETIEELAKSIEAATGLFGRGMLLIRRGDLYFGRREIPLEPGLPPKELQPRNGLIETALDGTIDRDPNFDRTSGNEPPRLTQFKLTLKGRPDLKPGDLVKFNLPPEDVSNTQATIGSAILGIAGPLIPVLDEGFDNAVTLYVNSIKHQLSRTNGFVTYVTGVSIPGIEIDNPWDIRSPSGSRPVSNSTSYRQASSSASAAQSVQQIAERVANSKYFAEIGEVRQMQTTGKGSQTENPGQTLTVFRGLLAPDGGANQASRLAIQRTNPLRLPGVAYLRSCSE